MHYKLHAKIYIYIMRKLVIYVPAYFMNLIILHHINYIIFIMKCNYNVYFFLHEGKFDFSLHASQISQINMHFKDI